MNAFTPGWPVLMTIRCGGDSFTSSSSSSPLPSGSIRSSSSSAGAARQRVSRFGQAYPRTQRNGPRWRRNSAMPVLKPSSSSTISTDATKIPPLRPSPENTRIVSRHSNPWCNAESCSPALWNGNVPGYLIAHAEPPDYVVLDADAGAAHALGSSLQAIHGANLLTLLDASIALGPLRETIRDAVRSNEACNALVRVEADTRILERQITAVPSSDHGPQIRIIFSEDALRENGPPRLDAIVDAISHEFRSPLNAALTWASLLELDPAPATVEKAAAVIRESVKTQARLIDDLIEVSRTDARANAIDAPSVDLGELLVRSMIDARAFLPPTIAADTVVPNGQHFVSGDATRLERVIHHLIRNASSAMSGVGAIVATLIRRDNDLLVDVTDHGLGMSADQISRTFRSFWRADRQRGGAGVGLGVVRTIIAQHGGCVCARSAGLGRGSTFTFTLPIQRD